MAKRKGLSGGGSRARKRERKLATLTMSKVRRANAAADHHWFDKDTLRFFRSKVSPTIYKGSRCAYFVTSEEGPSGGRRYSIRKTCDGGGKIDTVGDFQRFSTLSAAREEAKRIAKREKGKA